MDIIEERRNYMKKAISLLLALVMCLSLCACGGGNNTVETTVPTEPPTAREQLTELEEILEGVKNYKITVKEVSGSILFLRKIIRGGTNKSFGIEVAELAGVSKEIVVRAKELLSELSKKDLTKKIENKYDKEENNLVETSEVERILKDVDINNMSPMQAFIVLSDLVEKVKG